MDAIVACIQDRFGQPAHTIICTMESLLIKACKKEHIASGRTSPVHSRHSRDECYIGEIVKCATTSQKLPAHHELSAVAARSQ